jgi:hypothetical protein
MTRDEAETIVRATPLICRGPRSQDLQTVLAVATAQPLIAATDGLVRLDPDLDPKDWPLDVAAVACQALNTTDEGISALLTEGFTKAASELDALTRAGCGYNLNDTICQFPFDGQEREEDCPWCGVHRTYRSPRFD